MGCVHHAEFHFNRYRCFKNPFKIEVFHLYNIIFYILAISILVAAFFALILLCALPFILYSTFFRKRKVYYSLFLLLYPLFFNLYGKYLIKKGKIIRQKYTDSMFEDGLSTHPFSIINAGLNHKVAGYFLHYLSYPTTIIVILIFILKIIHARKTIIF